MRVLMLSQDKQVLDPHSSVSKRIASYGSIFDELDVVVFGVGDNTSLVQLAENVCAIPVEGDSKLGTFFKGRRELLRLTTLKQYDVISVQDPFFLGLLGFLISRRRMIPLQVQLHTDCFSKSFFLESPRRFIESLLARVILKNASCVRVVSERVLQSVRTVTHAPVSVLPIRAGHTLQESAVPKTVFPQNKILNLLAVSRFTKEKQIHLLLEALPHIPNAELTLVGDGPLRKRLESRVQRLGLNGRVHFVGWQNPSPYYATADVFLQMSRFEGYGMTLIEAGLFGLPIITTDVGIVGEVLRDKEEVVVIAPNSHAISEAVARLLANPTDTLRMGERAKSAALRAQGSTEEYLARYREAMHSCCT